MLGVHGKEPTREASEFRASGLRDSAHAQRSGAAGRQLLAQWACAMAGRRDLGAWCLSGLSMCRKQVGGWEFRARLGLGVLPAPAVATLLSARVQCLESPASVLQEPGSSLGQSAHLLSLSFLRCKMGLIQSSHRELMKKGHIFNSVPGVEWDSGKVSCY